ncbi:Putative 50S ribosomal protein L25/general stress protein Ctc [Candidatus Phycorickettsia trachydisci]|uniref:Large ribosomal subunit protein bL25 n=1 Tax=Candidatus Phycorickettsia trachydisci TaxID=2115978 RepID=A0A2P1P7F5_9RICK|nr:50S ribosomal protein L25/general stress protein Ctc [Candidatus Phycorickettsia trachydisci]AVP87199.1 Putative 50S ribosomal protein L25/general stress protein Ctc [Candidatus Phycorickettsia trachydisci]
MIEMQASIRSDLGSSASRRILKAGQVPAVIYGHDKENIHLSLSAKEVTKLYHSGCLTSTLINLSFEDGKKTVSHKALIKQIQCDPVKDNVRHVEMMFVAKGKQEVDVPITFENKEKCPGVKRGGYFNIIHRKAKVKCPIDGIPLKLTVDASNARIGQKVLAKHIILPEGIALAMKEDTIIASVTGRGKSSDAEDANRPEAAGK